MIASEGMGQQSYGGGSLKERAEGAGKCVSEI